MKPNQKYQSLSDEALLSAFVQNREQKAFSCLYQRYFESFSKYLFWLTGNFELGKDIAQNIFLKIYQNPQAFDASRNFKVWLFSIGKNQWKNEMRNAAVRKKHIELIGQMMKNNRIDLILEEPEKKQKLLEIQKALEKLSEMHKEVFILKYSNNLTIKEIGAICECSEGTVKSRLFYALKNLKEQLNIDVIKES